MEWGLVGHRPRTGKAALVARLRALSSVTALFDVDPIDMPCQIGSEPDRWISRYDIHLISIKSNRTSSSTNLLIFKVQPILLRILTCNKKITTLTISAIAFAATSAFAGLIAWGACQTACNTGYGVCCASAGTIAGKSEVFLLDPHIRSFPWRPSNTDQAGTDNTGIFTLGIGIPAALVTCSAVQGACMVACTPLLVDPTP